MRVTAITCQNLTNITVCTQSNVTEACEQVLNDNNQNTVPKKAIKDREKREKQLTGVLSQRTKINTSVWVGNV